MITIAYGNSMSRIVGGMFPKVIQSLSDTLSYEVPGADKTDAYIKGWRGDIKLFHKGNKSFPTGLLYLVEKILQEHEVEYEIVGRSFPDILGDIDFEKTNLREYQLKAVLDSVKAGRGVIQFPVASGKSHIAVGMLSLIDRKSLIVVHRKELLDQMIEHCINGGFYVGKIQGKQSIQLHHYEGWDKDVYCAMVQTLSAIRKSEPEIFQSLSEKIEVFIVDEAHQVGAKNYFQTMMAFSNTPYRFGMSGTPKGRSDNADLLLTALTGDVVALGDETELMKSGWIATPKVIMVKIPAPHSNRYDWTMIYEEAIVNNLIRNNYIRDIAVDLMNRGKMVLILCNYIKHGMILKDLINNSIENLPPVEFIHGSTPQSIRDEEINKFKRASKIGLIMSDIGSTGLDIPDCDAMINTAGGKSFIKVIQRAGRAMRPKKDGQAIIVDFMDYDTDYGMLTKHSKQRFKAYKNKGFDINLV